MESKSLHLLSSLEGKQNERFFRNAVCYQKMKKKIARMKEL